MIIPPKAISFSYQNIPRLGSKCQVIILYTVHLRVHLLASVGMLSWVNTTTDKISIIYTRTLIIFNIIRTSSGHEIWWKFAYSSTSSL